MNKQEDCSVNVRGAAKAAYNSLSRRVKEGRGNPGTRTPEQEVSNDIAF